jgi:hypothetical protein
MQQKTFTSSPTILIVALFVLSTATFSQKTSRTTTPRPAYVVELINDARLAAPELTVNVLLRAIKSNKVADPSWKKELLEEAFRTLENVKYPVSLGSASINGLVLNSTEYYLQRAAYRQNWDRLSLRAELIDEAVSIDPELAKEMIFQIGGRLDLKPRTCDDVLTYWVGSIYSTVAKVAKASFSEKQVREGQRALFLLPWIENIESPTQLPAVLYLVSGFQSDPAEGQMLRQAMSRVLRRRFNDDRSFTTAVTWGEGLASQIAKLTASDPDPEKAELTLAYREFLLKNLSDTRCKENEIRRSDPLPQFVEAANKLFPQQPLTLDDIASTDLGGSAKVTDLALRSNSIQKLRSDLTGLKGAGTDGRLIEKPDPLGLDWQAKALDLADRLLSWEGENGETDREVLMVRAGLFLGLLEDVSVPDLRKTLVRKYLTVLADSPVQRSSFIEWSVFVVELQEKSPELVKELVREFSNPNLKVMVESKTLDDPDPKPNSPPQSKNQNNLNKPQRP